MGKVIKCTICNSFYNGEIYNNCPYCEDARSVEKENSSKLEQMGGSLLKLKGKLIKNHSRTTIKETEKETQTSGTKEKQSEMRKTIGIFSDVAGNMDVGDLNVKLETSNTVSDENYNNGSKDTVINKQEQQDESDIKTIQTEKMSLSQALQRSGRTVGKYFSNMSGVEVSPVVGWLVAVKGAYQGQSFQLKSGRNKIGRSHEMDVQLINDESVSRQSVAVIIFDSRAIQFSIMPGESDSLSYVNNQALYERTVLKGYERIEFGEQALNCFIFVPFCGENFSWQDIVTKGERND